MPSDSICRCGHDREHHDHLRRGTDCAVCGPGACATFRVARRSPSGALHAVLARLAPRRSGAVLDHPAARPRPGSAREGGDGSDPVAKEA